MSSEYVDAGGMGFAPLTEWFLGPVKMALVRVAIELGVPDLLWNTGGLSALSARLGAHERNLERLLDGMAAMDLIQKQGPGLYANTRFSDMYLRTTRPTYLGEMVINLCRMQHSNLESLRDLVFSGPPEISPEKRITSEAHWQASARHLAAYHKAGIAEWAAGLVEELPEFPAMHRMLDLGGGPGLIGMAMLGRNPRLLGVLCDLPPVIKVAREEASALGLIQRMTFIEGDYNEVDLGRDYDLIWASHNLYFAKDLDGFLAMLHQRLNPGGVFISLHEGVSDHRTRPPACVLSRLNLAMEGQDRIMEYGVIARAMQSAGFASITSSRVDHFMGPLQLDIARKARRK